MTLKNILLAVLLLPGPVLNAQDIHFSQSPETPLLLNPAQAGLGHDVLVIMNYKDQWKSVATPYHTFNFSADFSLFQKPNGNHIGMGIDVFADKAGDAGMGTTTGMFHLSGVIAPDNNNNISAGISGGFGQRTLQYDKLYWDNQYDGAQYNAALSSGEPLTFGNHNYFDLAAGLAWFYSEGHSTLSSNDARRINIGFAVHHLNRPVYSFYGNTDERLPFKFIAHGNANIGIHNYNLVLEPSYLVMIQGGHREITPGIMFKYITQESSKYTGRKKSSAFALGGYFRVQDAFVLATRFEISNWAVGMSYDVNVSGLKTASKSRGGFEISLRYMSPNPFGGKGHANRLFD
jgi:type IX secretion system PorP/SprF family membrane protein